MINQIVNYYKPDKQIHPHPWWLNIGDKIHGKVLLAGIVEYETVRVISSVASSVSILSQTAVQGFDENEFDNVNVLLVADITEKMFDVIIVNSPDKVFDIDVLADLNEHYLNDDGILGLYEPNHYDINRGLNKLFEFIKNIRNVSRSRTIKSRFTQSGVTCLPSLSYGDRIYSSFAPGLYRSNKNTFLFKEKIKNIVFNTRFFRFFHSSNIWIIRKKLNTKILAETISTELAKYECANYSTSMKCNVAYYKYGKLILGFTDFKDIKNECIVVLALREEAIIQRDNERNIISILNQNPKLSGYLRGDVIKSKFLSFDSFIMTKTQGLIIDEKTPDMENMTKNAYTALLEITMNTLQTQDNNNGLTEKLNVYLNEMENRANKFKPQIDLLRKYTSKFLANNLLPTVCLHGDLKLENFVLDNKFKVSGIIDWELSELDSFPLLDLLYLIAYNKQVSEDIEFSLAYKAIWNDDYRMNENSLIDDYREKLAISDEKFVFLKIVFFIQHYGVRYTVNPECSNSLQPIANCFEHILSYLEGIQ